MLSRVPVCHPGKAVLMKKGSIKVTEPAIFFRGFVSLPFQAHSHGQSCSQSLVFLEKLLAAHLEGFYSQPCVPAPGWGQNLSMPLFSEVRTCEKQFPRCTKQNSTWLQVCARHFSYSHWILAPLNMYFYFSPAGEVLSHLPRFGAWEATLGAPTLDLFQELFEQSHRYQPPS